MRGVTRSQARIPFAIAWGLLTMVAQTSGKDGRSADGPELVLLNAGTPVGEVPPRGWSHLIVKSIPRLDSGDLDSLPSIADSTATLFRTVILADIRHVSGPATQYELQRVGLAMCVPVKGVDTVVTPATGASPPFALGIVERQVLARSEEHLEKARLIARSPTFAVLAAPAELKTGGAHAQVLLYYVMLVDARSGRLRTILWSTAADPRQRVAPKSLTLLPRGLVFRCNLDVTAERLLGTLPVNWSFAMASLPPGRQIDFPESLRPWSIDPKKIAAEPSAFESAVRAVVISETD